MFLLLILMLFMIKMFSKSSFFTFIHPLAIFRFCVPQVGEEHWKLWPGNVKHEMRHKILRYLRKQIFSSIKSYFQLLINMFFLVIYLFYYFLSEKDDDEFVSENCLFVKFLIFYVQGSQKFFFFKYCSQCEIKLGAILLRMTSVVEIHWKNAFHVAL